MNFKKIIFFKNQKMSKKLFVPKKNTLLIRKDSNKKIGKPNFVFHLLQIPSFRKKKIIFFLKYGIVFKPNFQKY